MGTKESLTSDPMEVFLLPVLQRKKVPEPEMIQRLLLPMMMWLRLRRPWRPDVLVLAEDARSLPRESSEEPTRRLPGRASPEETSVDENFQSPMQKLKFTVDTAL